MERPLRKLTRLVIEDSDLLERYIESPVKTLVADTELKIIGLLKKLESNINNLTLELKDKKRDKVLETVKGLTDEFFAEFLGKYHELQEQKKKLMKEINDNPTLKKKNMLQYELGNVKDNLEKTNEDLTRIQSELSKINITEMKNNLSKDINELLNVDIVVA